jgi:hypothetical protein
MLNFILGTIGQIQSPSGIDSLPLGLDVVLAVGAEEMEGPAGCW